MLDLKQLSFLPKHEYHFKNTVQTIWIGDNTVDGSFPNSIFYTFVETLLLSIHSNDFHCNGWMNQWDLSLKIFILMAFDSDDIHMFCRCLRSCYAFRIWQQQINTIWSSSSEIGLAILRFYEIIWIVVIMITQVKLICLLSTNNIDFFEKKPDSFSLFSVFFVGIVSFW